MALSTAPAVAAASPIDVKRAEAQRVSALLDAQAARITSLDRQFRRTRQRLDETAAALVRAEAQLGSAEQRRGAARERLTRHAVEAYVHAGSVAVIEQLSAGNTDLSVRRHYLTMAAGADRAVIDELKAAREDLGGQRLYLHEAKRQAQLAAQKLGADRDAVQRARRSQVAGLGRLKGELAALVAAEQARRDAEAARRALAARSVPRVVRSGAPGDVWACIRQLESGNNYGSPGGGAYQFQDDTWHSLGQSGTASDAPPEVQDAMAVELQRRSGWSQWTTAPACGRA